EEVADTDGAVGGARASRSPLGRSTRRARAFAPPVQGTAPGRPPVIFVRKLRGVRVGARPGRSGRAGCAAGRYRVSAAGAGPRRAMTWSRVGASPVET